jgi:hypothetical protein
MNIYSETSIFKIQVYVAQLRVNRWRFKLMLLWLSIREKKTPKTQAKRWQYKSCSNSK